MGSRGERERESGSTMSENVQNPGACTSAVDPPQIRLQLMSNPLYLSGARELVSAVAKRLGFVDEACGKIALAVDEALCNVIRHGYGRDPNRPIWVSIWPVHGCGCGGSDVHPGALKIVIEDEARQVDPAVIRSRDLEEIRPGGLGVHIIRAVMDEVKYEKRGPIGMRLTMIKRRHEDAEDDQADGARKESEGG